MHIFLCGTRVSALLALSLLAACANQQASGPGLTEAGRLTPCPGAPRCVNSDDPQRLASAIAPIDVSDYAPSTVWPALRASIDELGGVVVRDTGDYLSASFMSDTMKFVDDLECRFDGRAGVIQVRSASRIGYYDFNVNRVRVERLRRSVIDRLRRP